MAKSPEDARMDPEKHQAIVGLEDPLGRARLPEDVRTFLVMLSTFRPRVRRPSFALPQNTAISGFRLSKNRARSVTTAARQRCQGLGERRDSHHSAAQVHRSDRAAILEEELSAPLERSTAHPHHLPPLPCAVPTAVAYLHHSCLIVKLRFAKC